MSRSNEIRTAGLGLSVNTVKKVRTVLKVLFNLAVDNGLIAENPIAKTKLPPAGDPLANSLTIEEANAFVSVKDEFWYGIAFVLQLHTGLRNQELLALIKDDVDFKNKTLRIERACKWKDGICVKVGKTKTRRSNRVIELEDAHLALIQLQLERLRKFKEGGKLLSGWPVNDKIDEWVRKRRPRLAHLYNERELLFPQRNGRIPPSNLVRLEFKQMLQRAGINDHERNFRWYDLRHTHASVLLTAGVPINEIADRMGHSIVTLLQTYAHVLRDRRRIASQVFADLIST
jgi:integrase